MDTTETQDCYFQGEADPFVVAFHRGKLCTFEPAEYGSTGDAFAAGMHYAQTGEVREPSTGYASHVVAREGVLTQEGLATTHRDTVAASFAEDKAKRPWLYRPQRSNAAHLLAEDNAITACFCRGQGCPTCNPLGH